MGWLWLPSLALHPWDNGALMASHCAVRAVCEHILPWSSLAPHQSHIPAKPCNTCHQSKLPVPVQTSSYRDSCPWLSRCWHLRCTLCWRRLVPSFIQNPLGSPLIRALLKTGTQLNKCLTGGNRELLIREKLLVIVLSQIKIFILLSTEERRD